jgi:proteasome accessory factor A
MRPILAGIETEYGIAVEERGADTQVEEAIAFVRSYPGPCHVGWDYRFEAPRNDLRGFRLDRLAYDPEDARFDEGKTYGKAEDVRSDRVLVNGARLYNDHGHPEYSTPECWGLRELALHDKAGEHVMRLCAIEYFEREGRRASLYKNNADFHGATYGTHESYCVPRSLGFETMLAALLPMLVARQIVCGAGKVGAASGGAAEFQISQRADFISEVANAETLYRRPIFNTRDEPHADPARYARLHVICGDANRMPGCTARKVGLVKLGLHLALAGETPTWRLRDPVRAFQAISRDMTREFRVELDSGWTTAYQIIESYLDAAVHALGLREGADGDGFEAELGGLIAETRELLEDVRNRPERAARRVDWLAKRRLVEEFGEPGATLAQRQAYDLEYTNVDPDESLYDGLLAMGEIEPDLDEAEVAARLRGPVEPTRAAARAEAVRRYPDALVGVSWGRLTMRTEQGTEEIELDPWKTYPEELLHAPSVEAFVARMKE